MEGRDEEETRVRRASSFSRRAQWGGDGCVLSGPWVDAFRQGLRALGYVEDQTIALEIRWDEGDPGRWPDLAAELVVRNVDILVAGSGSAAQATKRTTTTMPIVMLVGVDPVAQGLVTSLTHPGGNITGLR